MTGSASAGSSIAARANAAAESGILVHNVSKTFRRAKETTGVQALQHVSLDIKPNTLCQPRRSLGLRQDDLAAHAERTDRSG